MNIVYLSILSNVLIINDSIAFKYHIYKIKILSKAQTFIVYLSILSNNIALKRIFSILITREITDMTPTQRPRIRIQWMFLGWHSRSDELQLKLCRHTYISQQLGYLECCAKWNFVRFYTGGHNNSWAFKGAGIIALCSKTYFF